MEEEEALPLDSFSSFARRSSLIEEEEDSFFVLLLLSLGGWVGGWVGRIGWVGGWVGLYLLSSVGGRTSMALMVLTARKRRRCPPWPVLDPSSVIGLGARVGWVGGWVGG